MGALAHALACNEILPPLRNAFLLSSNRIMSQTIDPHIFRAYDIRGDVRTQLTPDAAYRIGCALTRSHFPPGSTVAVGCDARTHSPSLVRALIEGLTKGGVHVVDYGQITTPMLYFALAHVPRTGGIMVTGSHNPIHDNGLKICCGTRSFVGDDIQRVRASLDQPLPATEMGTVTQENIFPAYREAIVSRVHLQKSLKLVVDAGNGVAGPYILPILKDLGCEVVPLFCDPDGNFPHHHPDPGEAKNLVDCQKQVLAVQADLGLAFDGDGDRLGVVTQTGDIIPADRLLILFERAILNETPGATIIGDVKCSKFTFDDIRKHGGNPVMVKTGHALIKQKLRETQAAMAGEMSGHFFFHHRWFGFDDAIYAAARLLEIAASSPEPLANQLQDLPQSFATPELRLDCPDAVKFELTRALVDHYQKQYPTNTLDGARVDFPHGWALMRASNTQPVLVVRVEADAEQAKIDILKNIADNISSWMAQHDLSMDLSALLL